MRKLNTILQGLAASLVGVSKAVLLVGRFSNLRSACSEDLTRPASKKNLTDYPGIESVTSKHTFQPFGYGDEGPKITDNLKKQKLELKYLKKNN